MFGRSEEQHFGEKEEITLITYLDAAYLKDDIDNIRILFTGFQDKQKAYGEALKLLEYHRQKEASKKTFIRGSDL